MTRSRSRLHSLRDLFHEELKDLYNAEQQIAKLLPKMVTAASSSDLRSALERHLEETRGHIERLHQIFERESISGKSKKCEGMEGLLKEGAELLQAKTEPEVRDAGLIGAAQRVEHYEIAVYGTVRTFAEQLGKQDIAKTLQETLDEEGAADKKLTEIAQHINVKAAETDTGDSEAGPRGNGEGAEDDQELE